LKTGEEYHSIGLSPRGNGYPPHPVFGYSHLTEFQFLCSKLKNYSNRISLVNFAWFTGIARKEDDELIFLCDLPFSSGNILVKKARFLSTQEKKISIRVKKMYSVWLQSPLMSYSQVCKDRSYSKTNLK
jgi:hypothetical protein